MNIDTGKLGLVYNNKEVNKSKKTDSNLKERASKQDIKNINKIISTLRFIIPSGLTNITRYRTILILVFR